MKMLAKVANRRWICAGGDDIDVIDNHDKGRVDSAVSADSGGGDINEFRWREAAPLRDVELATISKSSECASRELLCV